MIGFSSSSTWTRMRKQNEWWWRQNNWADTTCDVNQTNETFVRIKQKVPPTGLHEEEKALFGPQRFLHGEGDEGVRMPYLRREDPALCSLWIGWIVVFLVLEVWGMFDPLEITGQIADHKGEQLNQTMVLRSGDCYRLRTWVIWIHLSLRAQEGSGVQISDQTQQTCCYRYFPRTNVVIRRGVGMQQKSTTSVTLWDGGSTYREQNRKTEVFALLC